MKTIKVNRLYIILLILVNLCSCTNRNFKLVPLQFQKDLFPEGIAIDEKSNTIYLNSLLHNKIIACNIDGSQPKEMVLPNQYGYLPGFGMLVKGDTLFALGNSLAKKDSKSILLLVNIKTGAFIDSFFSTDSTFKYLNDLTVGNDGAIYITDSESNKIYTISKEKKKLELYLESNEIANSNGITISDDNKYLYFASYKKGLRIVEKSTRKIVNESNLDFIGIDGLKFYKNSLIAIVNGKKDPKDNGIYRFYLNNGNDKIERKEKIKEFGNEIKLPTTFVILGEYIYFITNTQIDNIDENTSKIKDNNKLEAYQLMKLKI